MANYIIDKEIKRFDIFRPGKPLTKWYSEQKDKPDILLNASLYSSTYVPCGTIYNDGKLVSNQGKGFGIGTVDKHTVEFGGPWDKQWYDYITAYYGIVQNGKAITDPPWTDKYVFGNALNRIAIGRMKDGKIVIATANVKKIAAFAEDSQRAGIVDLVNLDGGGSRALLWMGKWIHTSTRTPYNAIAIWLEKDDPVKEDTTDVKGDETMKVVCNAKTQVYDANGKVESGRYIAKGDICTMNTTVLSTMQVQIEYPISGGKTRTAYVKDLGNFRIG